MINEKIESARHELLVRTNDASAEAMYQDALVEATEQHIRGIEEGRDIEYDQLLLDILNRRIGGLHQTQDAALVEKEEDTPDSVHL